MTVYNSFLCIQEVILSFLRRESGGELVACTNAMKNNLKVCEVSETE